MRLQQRRESPLRRLSKLTGKVSWEARYTDSKGRRRSAGNYPLKREAQDAINNAYGRPDVRDTVGAYHETWSERYPRAERTNKTNNERIKSVLHVEIEGREFGDWPLDDLRRKHALVLVDVMLRVHGRATTGVAGVLRSLSAMAEDAITDELASINAFQGIRVRSNDPRVRKRTRPVRVWSWEQMHTFAVAAGAVRTTKTIDSKGRRLPDRGPCPLDLWRAIYAEPMIRTLSDCGLRLGELLPLKRTDRVDGIFTVRETAHEGQTQGGTKRNHLHGETAGERKAPCPPTLEGMLVELPKRLDTPLLYPTPTGRLWRERNWYRDVWYPAQRASGLDIRPHEMRHSWVTHLRAAGVDDADLADMAGHALATMLGRYTHPKRESFDMARAVIG
jgi:integrase